MKTLNLALAVIFTVLLAVSVSAAPGDLDPTFGNNGLVNLPIGKFFADFGLASAQQTDGKIIVAGRVFDGITSNFMVSR
jgi:hypothetical protein